MFRAVKTVGRFGKQCFKFVPCWKQVCVFFCENSDIAFYPPKKMGFCSSNPGNRRKWRVSPRQNDRLPRAPFFGNGPNTVSGSTVSNTELSEFFGSHRVRGRELSEFLSAYYLCVKVNSPSFSWNSPSLLQNSVSSLFRNSTPETVFRPFPSFDNPDMLLSIFALWTIVSPHDAFSTPRVHPPTEPFWETSAETSGNQFFFSPWRAWRGMDRVTPGACFQQSPLTPQITRNHPKPPISRKCGVSPASPRNSHWIHTKRLTKSHWIALSSPEFSRNSPNFPKFAQIPLNPWNFHKIRRGEEPWQPIPP